MRSSARQLPRAIGGALAGAALLVLVQQQLLERRPPRLLQITPRAYSSGPGALDLRFSRPLQRSSLAAASRLQPPLAHRWLGDEALQRLLLLPDQVVTEPLQLLLSGRDRRGQRLPTQLWRWDPRPHLLVVARVAGGEQLQLRSHNGAWRALSPVWARITSVEAMADGRGVVFLAGDRSGRYQLWKRGLQPGSLRQRQLDPWIPEPGLPLSYDPGGAGGNSSPQPGALTRLWPHNLSFAQMSSNRRGDLLLQLGGEVPGAEQTLWIDAQGRRHGLPLNLSGPIRLLPEGEGMVVPTSAGLELRSLRDRDARPQILPGSRVLTAFCPATGQALLMRHWPDYRRSLERVQPGAAPITLWIGQEAVMAASCNQSGDRIWMLLNRWQGSSTYTLMRLDRGGRVVKQRRLDPWIPEPGLPLSYDPVGDQLLLSVRRHPREPARAALLDGQTLRIRVLPQPISQALWLPAS